MEIIIRAIDMTSPIAHRDSLHMTSFSIDFDSDFCSGKAVLAVLHSSERVDITLVRQQILNQTLDVAVSVDQVYDFEVISDQGHDRIVSLGPPGVYSFEGRVVKHLISGEGSLFQVADIQFVLEVDMLPPDSLEVQEGTWVTFKTKQLIFWPHHG